MRNSRVFIGWSGPDNQEIARKVSNRLSESGFSSIISFFAAPVAEKTKTRLKPRIIKISYFSTV